MFCAPQVTIDYPTRAPYGWVRHSRFHAHRLAVGVANAVRLVAHANQEHRLAGVLQQIDNPRVLILKKNRFAIRHQVEIGGCVEQLGEAAAHFPLQEARRFQETGVTFFVPEYSCCHSTFIPIAEK